MRYLPKFLAIAVAVCLMGASAHADNGPYSGGGPYSGNGRSSSGGGGGGSLAISATTSNQTEFPVFATGAGTTSTLYVDTASPLAYNPGTGRVTAIGGINLLNTTTGNGLSFPVSNTDTTSLAIGPSALLAQTATGLGNVAVGFQALKSTITAYEATAVGYQALSSFVSVIAHGNSSTAVGYQALANQTGLGANGSTAVGDQAGIGITTGNDNICIGAKSCPDNNVSFTVDIAPEVPFHSGSNNVRIGAGAAKNWSGTSSVYIGIDAFGDACGTGSDNIVIGPHIGESTACTDFSSHHDILLIGTNSGLDTGSGTTNSVIGIGTGHPGAFDTMVGFGALASTTTDNNDSVAMGANSLNAVTTGIHNTAYGFGSGALVSTGTGNIAIGYNSLATVLTIGSNNIGIGNSLATSTSSTSNTVNIGGVITASGTNTPSTSTVTIPGNLTVTGTCTGCGGGGGAAFTPVLQPLSLTTTDTAGNLFPYTYIGTGGNVSPASPSWGVAASLGADVVLQGRFLMPPTLPASGTLNLCSLSQTNATSGVVKYTISDADVALNNSVDPSAATLSAETQTSITWTNASDYVETCTPLTETPTARHVSVVAITFNHTSWTLAQILSANFYEEWR